MTDRDPVTPQPAVEQNAGERLKRFACLETVDWKSVIERVEVVHKAEEPTKTKMKITREELLRRAQRVNHPLRGKCALGANICSRCSTVADLFEQAVKETAEECARICVEETDVQHCGSGYMREEWGVGTLAEAAREIRSAYGIDEVKRGDQG